MSPPYFYIYYKTQCSMNLWFDVFIPWAEWYHFNRHLPLMEAKQQYLQEKAAYEITIVEL